REDIVDVRSSPGLRTVLVADPVLEPFHDRRLENNGLTIEGIAVIGNRLFAGFRGPALDNARAPVISIAVDALFDGGAPQAGLYQVAVGAGRGVRDLARLGDGILLLAGPTSDDAGPYLVYWWNAASENLRLLADITKTTKATEDRKPEAILPLDWGPFGLRL